MVRDNTGKRWTEDDIGILIDYAQAGELMEWIGAQLGRSPSACRKQWQRLNAERQRNDDLEQLDREYWGGGKGDIG